MPVGLFEDGRVEIACARCSCTSPATTDWVRANEVLSTARSRDGSLSAGRGAYKDCQVPTK
jgi:hypothetical protein